MRKKSPLDWFFCQGIPKAGGVPIATRLAGKPLFFCPLLSTPYCLLRVAAQSRSERDPAEAGDFLRDHQP